MGETPEVVKIACPGCDTQFRLKPKKGRLPQGPVPCPKCAESIPVVEKNIRRDEPAKATASAPQAHVFGKSESEETKKTRRSRTASGSPVTPHRTDAVSADDDEFDHINVTPGLSDSNPKSTFLGMGSALASIDASSGDKNTKKSGSDRTAVVDGDLLAKIRSESSVVEDDDDQDAGPKRDPLNETAEHDVHVRETSENQAVLPEDAQAAATATDADDKHADDKGADPKDADEGGDDAEEKSSAPGQMVLGKIKIKKKLKRSLKKKQRAKESAGDQTTAARSDGPTKPSLSSLLKKARERKDKLDLPKPSKSADQSNSEIPKPKKSAEDLDRALDDLAAETARALGTDEANAAASNQTPPAYDTGDSTMIEMLRRRVAEKQQPGAASERRGSGYIRLPTAEIQDVLGQGTYRLRVEDIVYEPIDKEGLTQLVKRGVLLGAEEIADAEGDWMPIADHPVFRELRRKMAREAHDLLKQYGKPTPRADKAGDAELPAPQASLPGRVNELPTPASGPSEASPNDGLFKQADEEQLDVDGIPTLDADLEEEAEDAARDLFADSDILDEDHEGAPPPMPSAEAEAAAEPEPPPEFESESQPADDQSIELDYDALGVEEDEVEFTEPEPADEAPTGPGKQSSMRTWIPLLAAAVVLIGIAAFAFSPAGRPFLEAILGDGQNASSTDEAEAKSPDQPAKEDTSAKVDQAVAAAAESLHGALDIDPSDTALQKQVAGELATAGDHAGAAAVMGVLYKERSDDRDFTARYAEELIAAGRFADARAVAVDGMQLDGDDAAFKKLFHKALTANPALSSYEVIELAAGDHADSAEATGDGKRVVLRLQRDGAPAFTFKPAQSGWERGWRSDVATWRLCQMVVCGFEVPRTRPARLSKTAFDELTAEGAGPAADRLSRLQWVDEDGEKYVYGALQDAVAEPARFPIEDTELWRAWLLPGSSLEESTAALKQALAPVKNLPGNLYEPLVGQLDGASLPHVASQLSSVLVVDFLTNNWDRFRSGEDKWGTNLHFAAGSLISMDNGSAFQPRASTRVRGRFHWTSRFSRDTITSLRALERDVVSPRLFPNASAAEKAELDVFWSQRDHAIERVDELVAAHGNKEVLAFQ